MIYWLAHTLSRLVGLVFFRHKILHREFLPETGGALIVANHVSYLDPAVVGACFRKPIYYLARKSLFKGFLGWLLPRIQGASPSWLVRRWCSQAFQMDSAAASATRPAPTR